MRLIGAPWLGRLAAWDQVAEVERRPHVPWRVPLVPRRCSTHAVEGASRSPGSSHVLPVRDDQESLGLASAAVCRAKFLSPCGRSALRVAQRVVDGIRLGPLVLRIEQPDELELSAHRATEVLDFG